MGAIFKYGEPFSNTIKTRQLKQAEYDALSVAEKCNNTFYFITDANGEDGSFQPVIYSEEEREIGVWTDGKPLYQRTFVQSFTSSGKVTLDTGIEYCHTIQTSYLSSNVIDTPFYLQSSTYVYCYVQRELDNTMTINNYYNGSIEWIVTVQYTKATDTPGSGTWTPQGVPAVHYSTDEHVVGTWIDGSTIYEKTIIKNSGITANNTITHGISNFNKLVKATGTIETTGGYYEVLNDNAPSTYGIRFGDVGPSNFSVSLESNRLSNTSAIYITLQYTKTS